MGKVRLHFSHLDWMTTNYCIVVDFATLKAQLGPVDMNLANRKACLPETRLDILQDLFISLTVPNPRHNIIWFHGQAGSGKSTILYTLAQCFSKLHRRGAFLFWDRNDVVNSDPDRVIRTLAYQLARFNTIYARRLASLVNADPDITKASLDEQFQTLVQEPLATLAEGHNLGPIIIILDALDECGTVETRQNLLDVLSARLAMLPKMFRILVASRDEPEIRVSISHLDIDEKDLSINDESTRLDLLRLFRRRLVSNTSRFAGYELPPDWPGDEKIRQLVDLAQGLFIWASTSIRFIESGPPQDRLKKVLDAKAHGEPHRKLDKLYHIALTHPFSSHDGDERNAVRSILGAIVVAREPLTDDDLGQLLGLEQGRVHGILSRLRPILRWNKGKPAQLLHASLTDFLCDSERCDDPQWHIDTSSQHYNLASFCLQLMQRDLKFNICGIETSHRRHMEIDGIQERIDRAITRVLMYASQHWADHLELGSLSRPDSNLVHEAMDFINNRLLFWIEVFSLKNQMTRISDILRKAANWAKVRSLRLLTGNIVDLFMYKQMYDAELEAMTSEASKFVNAFGYPISQSVPHIYLSALPFLPSESTVLRRVRAAFQNTLSVEEGTSKLWPVIRQTLTGHSGPVASVAFSPDSTRVVSASFDGSVRMWDAVSGAPIDEPLRGHPRSTLCVSFSPDGTQVVSGSGPTIQSWDVMSGARIWTAFGEAFHVVFSVAYSPDGTRIISGSDDGSVQIWDAASGALICSPSEGHSGPVWSVAYSPDGTRIASGSGDRAVRTWDV